MTRGDIIITEIFIFDTYEQFQSTIMFCVVINHKDAGILYLVIIVCQKEEGGVVSGLWREGGKGSIFINRIFCCKSRERVVQLSVKSSFENSKYSFVQTCECLT
jgi:hypothetical protein